MEEENIDLENVIVQETERQTGTQIDSLVESQQEVQSGTAASLEAESAETVSREKILEILLNTREQGQMVEQMIKNQIQVKDQMIDRLHKELSGYKEDASERFSGELMKSVIKIRKNMGKLIESDKWKTMDADAVKEQYQYIFEDITDLLELHSIDPYRSNPGDCFDAAVHQPKAEKTTDVALDKIVKESISEGYKKGDKVIVPERVIVYQYKE